jgi:hypothetical protein
MSSGGDDDVGYGRPPKRYQFKKGQCPNSTGRGGKGGPRGKTGASIYQEFAKALREEMSRTISVKDEEGRIFKIKRVQALARKFFIETLKKPDPRALQAIADIIERGENDNLSSEEPFRIIVQGGTSNVQQRQIEMSRSDAQQCLTRLNRRKP